MIQSSTHTHLTNTTKAIISTLFISSSLENSINRAILAFLLLFTSSAIFAEGVNDFVSTWKTTTGTDTITLPISGSPSFRVMIDWGDNITETIITANPTHTYTNAGTHIIRVSGIFDRINMNDAAGDATKLLAITQWGTTRWRTMFQAFQGVKDLSIPISAGVPNLSAVTDMSYMFFLVENFNSDISSWDASNITNMDAIFFGATNFDQNIINWDVSNVMIMVNMFTGADSFSQNLGNWYIVPSTTSILNIAQQTITIGVRNSALQRQHLMYRLGTGADNDRFSITDNVLTLITPDTSATAYELNIISTGGFVFSSPNKATDQITFTISALITPSINTSVSSLYANVGTPITPVTIISSGGLVAEYSISPTISGSLSFATNTGIISGIPSVTTNEIIYTITATNAVGIDTATVAITVLADDINVNGCVLVVNPTNVTFDPMFYLLLGVGLLGLIRSGNRLQVTNTR